MYVLSCGQLVVGRIKDPFCSDETWYGKFECLLEAGDDPLGRRALDFIAFCEEWHERLYRKAPLAGDAGEFDRYSDVIRSGLWEVETETAERHRIEDAPVCFRGAEMSWRLLGPTA
jgi:hypothetical protein